MLSDSIKKVQSECHTAVNRLVTTLQDEQRVVARLHESLKTVKHEHEQVS